MSEYSAEKDALAAIRDLLPAECWVSRSDAVFCTDFIGGTFGNGAVWTEDMCCLPCRIRRVVPPAKPCPYCRSDRDGEHDPICPATRVTPPPAEGRTS